jgi:plasmid stability protein
VPHQIVAVERDVERAGRDVVAVDVVDGARQAPRQRHAASADADQRELIDGVVAFEDFVRDPREAAADSGGVENDWHRGPLRVLAGTR